VVSNRLTSNERPGLMNDGHNPPVQGCEDRAMLRAVALGIATSVLAVGCAMLPPLPRTVDNVVPTCARAPDYGGLVLACDEAVAAALSSLNPIHPPIDTVTFEYGPCPDLGPNVAVDCAIHLFGTVMIEFVGGEPPPLMVSVEHSGPSVVVTGVEEAG
jgi:hypothetical protein